MQKRLENLIIINTMFLSMYILKQSNLTVTLSDLRRLLLIDVIKNSVLFNFT